MPETDPAEQSHTPKSLDYGAYQNLLDVFNQSCQEFADRPAFSNLGLTVTYAQLAAYSDAFAAYLQHQTDLQPRDCIAIQLPNLVQYPVALFGALKAGLIVVNTNPLYTPREMLYQFQDADVKGIVVLANMAHKVEQVLPETRIKTLIITEVGDLHPQPQRFVINGVVKWIKRAVAAYNLPQAVPLLQALAALGKDAGKNAGKAQSYKPCHAQLDDLAVLQYTGGTTGVAKAAMLTHGNLLANMLQVKELLAPIARPGEEIIIAPLPLYHIYSFTVNCMVMMEIGAHVVLIPNPRDFSALVKELKRWPFTMFSGLNTLFVALCKTPAFRALDFSHLKLTLSGGMALTHAAAHSWQELTGCEIVEGYGLTETSPVISVNPPLANHPGTIGKPLPFTQIKIIDEQGQALAPGNIGELCVRGPQVMEGYWRQVSETAKVLSADGWFKTGDMAEEGKDGYLRIVDRKKDMIIISGFNVYPNEVEDVLCQHPDIEECAVVGVAGNGSGEVVKAFIVSSNPQLKAKDVLAYARQFLTSYKVPHQIEFRDSLPKSNVGKVLRRELRG